MWTGSAELWSSPGHPFGQKILGLASEFQIIPHHTNVRSAAWHRDTSYTRCPISTGSNKTSLLLGRKKQLCSSNLAKSDARGGSRKAGTELPRGAMQGQVDGMESCCTALFSKPRVTWVSIAHCWQHISMWMQITWPQKPSSGSRLNKSAAWKECQKHFALYFHKNRVGEFKTKEFQ